jgi:hypothetical protein
MRLRRFVALILAAVGLAAAAVQPAWAYAEMDGRPWTDCGDGRFAAAYIRIRDNVGVQVGRAYLWQCPQTGAVFSSTYVEAALGPRTVKATIKRQDPYVAYSNTLTATAVSSPMVGYFGANSGWVTFGGCVTTGTEWCNEGIWKLF